MKLRKLDIRRLPGIPKPLELDGFDDGINVVVGPNASGKSSLLRALRALLYREESADAALDLEADFDVDGAIVRAQRSRTELTWRRSGTIGDAPRLPEHRFLSCYTLRIEDLLSAEGKTEEAIADEVARQLAGGFDLRAVRQDKLFSLKKTHGKSEAEALRKAEDDLRSTQRAHRELRAQEAQLAGLEEELKKAKAAEREQRFYEAAKALLDLQRSREDLEAQGRAFSLGLDVLHGGELQQLDDIDRDVRSRETDLAAVQRTLADQIAILERSNLDIETLTEQALAARKDRLRTLQGVESELRGHEKAVREAEVEVSNGLELLGAKPDASVSVSATQLTELQEALDARRAQNARLDDLEAQLAGLSETEVPLERLRDARTHLMGWLSAPEPSVPTTKYWVGLVLLTTVAVGATVAVGVVLHPGALALVALVLLGTVLLWPSRGNGAERTTAQSQFAKTGVPPPGEWSSRAVQERLHSLEDEIQAGVQRNQEALRRRELERQVGPAREMLERSTASLQQFLRGLGVPSEKLDAGLFRWLELVTRYEQANTKLQALRARLQQVREEAESHRRQLLIFLDAQGVRTGESDADTSTIESCLDELQRRLGEHKSAQERRKDAEEKIARLSDESSLLSGRRAEVLNKAGVGTDENELRKRLEQLDDWKQFSRDLAEARLKEAERAKDLAGRTDLLSAVRSGEEEKILAWQEETDELARRVQTVADKLSEIRHAVSDARKGRGLEECRTEVTRAKDDLEAAVELAMFAEAGTLLLEEVESEYKEARQPEALKKAKDWFGRFTRHEFELVFDSGGQGSFAARDTRAGELRGLSELSSGTRMQLLIAVRLAFAMEAESGHEPIPLFLDEALTTTDPERFSAIVGALRMLAEEDGRQIFYLTAQPGEVGLWKSEGAQVKVIDMRSVRGLNGPSLDPGRFLIPPSPAIAKPDGHSPEEYALRLKVQEIDPWKEGELDVFHILRDQLPLVHQLREIGISAFGPLREAVKSPEMQKLFEASELALLRRRVRAAEAWIEAWREGRGRPVDHDAIESSKAVTETFMEAVLELLEKTGGDAATLLQRLEAKEVPNFRAASRERLEEFFVAEGYLSETSPLSNDEILLRVVGPLLTQDASRETAVAEARVVAESLQHGLRGTATDAD